MTEMNPGFQQLFNCYAGQCILRFSSRDRTTFHGARHPVIKRLDFGSVFLCPESLPGRFRPASNIRGWTEKNSGKTTAWQAKIGSPAGELLAMLYLRKIPIP
jgi:hypothetical protein